MNSARVALAPIKSCCPDCAAKLDLLRVMSGGAAKYWAFRCVGCGTVQLDITDLP